MIKGARVFCISLSIIAGLAMTSCTAGSRKVVGTPSNSGYPGIYDSLKEVKESIKLGSEAVDKESIDSLFEQRESETKVGDLSLDSDIVANGQNKENKAPVGNGAVTVNEDGTYKAKVNGDLKPYVDLSKSSISQSEYEVMKAVAVELYTRKLNSKLKENRYVVVSVDWEPGEIENLDSPVLYEINDGELLLRAKIEVYDKDKSEKQIEVRTFVLYYEGDVAVLK